MAGNGSKAANPVMAGMGGKRTFHEPFDVSADL